MEKERETQKTAGRGEPCLYASEVQPVDGRGKKIPGGIRYPERKPGFGNALVENICTGCTCVLNRELLLLFCDTAAGRRPMPCHVIMHDFWLYLLAGAFGRIIFDNKSYIYYRQHGENTVGMVNFKKNRGKLRKQAGELKRLYGKELEGQDKGKAELLEGFVAGKKRLAFGGKLYRQRKSDDLIMKVFLLLGWL